MAILRHSVWLLAVLLLYGTALAQQDAPFLEQAQKKFDYGLLQFDLEHWQSAAQTFEDVARKYPTNHRTTAAFVMAARAYLLYGKPSYSLRLIEDLQRRFPNSTYLAEAYLIAGDAAIAAGTPSTALRWYVQSWFAEGADRVAISRKIQDVHPAEIPVGERRFVKDFLATMPLDNDLRTILRWDTPGPGGTMPLANTNKEETSEPVRIAVALPMHEKDARRSGAVRDLRDGMLAALDMHRTKKKTPVIMELLDSGNEDSLRNAMRRLDMDERAMVLLAGAFSDDAERVCRIAGELGPLVLIPTATAEELTTYGSNIFQLNTPILHRARLLADFCYLELDAHEAIVLAPDHSYAHAMADAFMDRCRILKIPVQLAGSYGKNEEEVKQICHKIASMNGVKNGILFAPVQSRDDIVAVLNGIHEAGLTLPVVGGGNWNHPDLLARYGKGLTLYFESDVVEDTSSVEYKNLRETFSNRSSRALSREALFGFDAMNIALSLIDNVGSSRKSVREGIKDVFEGLRAPVNFQQQRVNAAMNILMSRNGSVRRLEAFHAK
ncbi:MAG: hypothetical protein IH600_13475 [Bacteroidetes bacterium]|nr:hypothetical protein [Bacteroidota bacterium]